MTAMKFLFVLWVTLLVATLSPSGARADVIPPAPGETPCYNKVVGDGCTDDDTGNAGRCRNATCTNTMKDGTVVNRDCVRCIPDDTDSGCSVGQRHSLPKRLGPFVLAGAFSSILLLYRRRRRRLLGDRSKAPAP